MLTFYGSFNHNIESYNSRKYQTRTSLPKLEKWEAAFISMIILILISDFGTFYKNNTMKWNDDIIVNILIKLK